MPVNVAGPSNDIETGDIAAGAVTIPKLSFDPGTQAELEAAIAAYVAAVEAHRADTTVVHGIADTGAVVLTNDARLSDSRPPALGLRAVDTAADVFSSGVVGDTVDRFVVNANGKLEWGPGNAGLDVSVERVAASTLRVNGGLLASANITALAGAAAETSMGARGPGGEAGFYLGVAGDTKIWRAGAGQVRVGSNDATRIFSATNAAGSTEYFRVGVDSVTVGVGPLNLAAGQLALQSAVPQLRFANAGQEQTTVGAAGPAAALPLLPTKYLKVIDAAGATLVIPAFDAA